MSGPDGTAGRQRLYGVTGSPSPMDPGYRALLEKQGYHLIGEHSAVKLCHWMRQRLLYGRSCYKERFYGISSHRCLQMTPTLDQCTQMCTFCWREQGFTDPGFFDACSDVGVERDEAGGEGPGRKVDDPETIVERSIEGQRALVSGFKGDPRCDEAMWEESRNPDQVAISLSGEPTLYPHLSDLIGLYKRRGMTVFLVTNGTRPDALAGLDELPSQLYVSVDAPDFETYRDLCRPMGDARAGWDALMETLDTFPSLDTRKVVRHTLVQGHNMDDPSHPAAYAELDERADPDFIEPKGYVFVGGSRMRLNIGCMPSHETVRAFGEALAARTGYELADEMKDSRVVLLAKDPGGRRAVRDQ